MTAPDTGTDPTGDRARYWYTWALAVVLVIAFMAGNYLLYRTADDKATTDVVWSRYIYLYGGIQAIVFTAVGWIFGREVNRGAAEVATKQVDATTRQLDDANAQAENARTDAAAVRDVNARLSGEATKGRALADAVRSLADPARTRSVNTGAPDQVDTLRDLADRLFPPAG